MSCPICKLPILPGQKRDRSGGCHYDCRVKLQEDEEALIFDPDSEAEYNRREKEHEEESEEARRQDSEREGEDPDD